MAKNIYKEIIDKSPFGFAHHKIIVDANNKAIDYEFLEINESFEKLTGLKGEEVIGRKASEVIPSILNDKFNWIEFYGNIALNQGKEDIEQYSEPLRKWYKVQVFSTELYYFTTIFIDFTHNKESELEIFKKKEQFELAVKGSNDGIWDWDLEKNELYLSSRWKEQLGYEDSELDNNFDTFKSLLHTDDIDRVLNRVNDYLNGKIKEYDIEFRMKHKDETYRWIRARGEALRSKNGKVYRMAGSHSDITEKKIIEEKLLEERENQKIILNGMKGVFVELLDSNMRVIFVNHEIKNKFNITDGLEHNQFCYKFIRGLDSPCPNCTALKAIKSGQVQEGEIEDDNGNIFKAKSTPIKDKYGNVSKIVHMWIDITEEKKIENQLRISEEKLRDERRRLNEIIKGTNVGTWEWNVQTGETIFNERWAEIIGYKLKELTPTTIDTWMKFTNKEDLKTSEKLLTEHFEGKRSYYECEARMKHRDGRWIWVLDRGHVASWTPDKKPLWVYGTHQDITEQKNKEIEIIEAKSMLETVMNSIPQYIFWKDTNSIYLGCNENGRKIANLERSQDIIGKSDYDLPWEKEEADFFRACDKRIMGSRVPENHIIEPLTKSDGSISWLDTSKIPLYDSQGKVNGILVAFEDITERKLIEEQLKISEKRYRGLIESQNDLIVRVDSEGKFTFVNEVYCKTFGKSEEELLGRSFAPLVHEEDIEGTLEAMNSLYKEPYRAYIEQRAKTVKGWRWLAWEDYAIRDSDNKIIEIQGVGRDITALKEAQLKAESANKAKTDFLANMSHEIRTPLNSVVGFSELMLDVEDIKPKYKEYLKNINISANSLLGIVNDILDLSKIEAGKLELDIIETNIIELAEEVIDIIKISNKNKNLELLLNIDSNIPEYIYADPIRLRQILLNLLGNAIKFTEKGEVELHLMLNPKKTKNKNIMFSVRDTGIGISEEKKERLFKAFSQGDSTTTRKFGGTGLGLVISNMLVNKMGGHIEVDSQEGLGSRFYFDIDIKFCDKLKSKKNNIDNIKSALVIDDNRNNRYILRINLEKWGIKVEEAEDGLIGLEKIKKKDFDLLIVDYNMPYMNGVEVINKVEDIENKNYTVLLYSSTDPEDSHKNIDLKLQKPVKSRELYEILNKKIGLQNKKELNLEKSTKDKESNYIENTFEYKILLVEDIEMNRLLVSELMKKILKNYRLIEAKNGQEAIELFRKEKPHLIFMDIQMPVMDGYKATEAIRKLDKGIPIIALTAGAIKAERDRCYASGVNDFIPKPIKKDIFQEKLMKWLKLDDNIYNTIKKKLNNDFEKALENIGGDINSFIRISKEYKKSVTKMLDELDKVLEKKDIDMIHYYIHSIKGMSGNVGLYNIQALSKKIIEKLHNKVIEIEEIKLWEIKVRNSLKKLDDFIKKNSINNDKGLKNQKIDDFEKFINDIKALIRNSDFIDTSYIEKLESYDTQDKDLSNLLQNLSSKIQSFEYEGALELIEELKLIKQIK